MQTIIIVEDDAVSAKATCSLFRQHGYFVLLADTVQKGLELIQGGFDFLILDLMLPDGDGESILRAIRDRNLSGWVGVTTGTYDADRLHRLMELDPDHVFAKPIDFNRILRAMAPAPDMPPVE